MAVLEKGFNYAITPKSIPKSDIVAGVETGLRQVRDAAAVGIAHAKVAAILKSAEPPSNNNITQEEEALKELKRNPKIVVMKADKGNVTVVIDSKNYVQKVNTMLTNECAYVKLPSRSNPINQISATVSATSIRLEFISEPKN